MEKRLVILGAGESGTGAAILGKKKGWKVFVSDNQKIKQKYKDVLIHADIDFEEEKHSGEIILQADLVVKSPGIPDTVSLVKTIRKQGIPVISEVEFAFRYTTATIIGITGSNGKTTTSLLIYHLLNKAGKNAGLAGNIGRSLALDVAYADHDILVVELSSFQLDGIIDFKPNIAILLNITPDHLDRYEDDFFRYADSKFRIALNQVHTDFFITNLDDPVIKQILPQKNIKSRVIYFSQQHQPPACQAFIHEKKKELHNNINSFTMTLESLALQGRHNIYNSMAASIIGSIFNIRKEVIKESLIDFKNIDHRLEYVATVHGVSFINDSKATNVNSTWYALESQSKPVIWIAGGVDKGNDYSLLNELVKEKVRILIALGDDNEKLINAFSDDVEEVVSVSNIYEAVQLSLLMANKDETVLLSPACASFNMFENYEERGNKFKEAVFQL